VTNLQSLGSNIRSIHQRIERAATRANRNPNDITLVAITKTFPAESILVAYEMGLRHFGENRVEEAAEKIPAVNAQAREKITWHLVGHLQSRKVKNAAPLFDYIHSVDSVELAERLDKNAASLDKTIPILFEVNVSGEQSKNGFVPEPSENFFHAAREILALSHLNIVGLMTIAPIVANPDDARPCFRALRVLRDELQSRHPDHALPHLSMGMTDDFEAAIAEGATMLRIGRAIFGERQETLP
jgi:pyridoxal phosphate enzyme (YggS family)